MCVINVSWLNHGKPNIGRNAFLRVMIHMSAERKVRGKHIIFDAICSCRQLRKPKSEQNVFHMTYIPSISKLESTEYVYPEFGDLTAYSQSKQTVMNASSFQR